MAASFLVVREEAIRLEVPFNSREGERVWLEARVVPEIAENGAVMGFLGVVVEGGSERSLLGATELRAIGSRQR